MEKWKKVFWKLLYPKTIIIFLLFNISLVSLLYVFWGQNVFEAMEYISYILSAYTLTVVCMRVIEYVEKIRKCIYNNKFTNRLMTDQELHIRISLYGGLLINIGFAAFNVVVWVLYKSNWFLAMAGYNTILSIMRFILVYRDQIGMKEESEYEKKMQSLHSYRVCGWLMLFLNIAVSVIVIMVVVDNQTITYPGFMIYAIAAFTFYYMAMATINIVKYWHIHNPVFSGVKRIDFAKALVSIFTLQVAMLTQFGEADGSNCKIINVVTGIVVCVFITVLAILMLVNVKRDYQIIQQENTNGNEIEKGDCCEKENCNL